VVLGTKGQIIKMAPILRELRKRKLDFGFVHVGQHVESVETVIREFDLPRPSYHLSVRTEVTSALQGVSWLITSTAGGLMKRKTIFRRTGLVLVHGDAPPAIVGLVLGKASRLKVAHVEAGLRSFDVLDPFPEELIRTTVDKFSDYLFAPSAWAARNLMREGAKGRVYNSRFNTVLDSVRMALSGHEDCEIEQPFALVTIHRLETILRRERLVKILQVLTVAARERKTVFVVHPPTGNMLRRFGMFDRLARIPNLQVIPRIIPYSRFISMVSKSDFVMTDGGGLQQETFYLGKPCLILRHKTEQMEGIGANVCVSRLDLARIIEFEKNYLNYRTASLLGVDFSPSRFVVDILTRISDR